LGAPYIKTSDYGLSEESVDTADRVLAVLRLMKILVFRVLFGEYCLALVPLFARLQLT